MITVYGIRQCDSCRKALKWLEAEGIEHRFHDLRADGLEKNLLASWVGSPFADQLVNRRSTTWRGLTDAEKASGGAEQVELLLANPTLLKRPIFAAPDIVAVGFKAAEMQLLQGLRGV